MASAVSTILKHKILVVGSTGATGKHVVRMLLDQGDTQVVALTRSKDKLLNLLNIGDKTENLTVKENSIGNLSAEELKDLTKGCSAVVSCLGHNLDFHGIYRDGYFVKEAVENVTAAMPSDSRYILMGSDGIAHPDGVTDPKRKGFDKFILRLMRWLLPPLVDNELSAKHLYESVKKDWCIVRPGDLTDKDEAEIYGENVVTDDYEIKDHPASSLFGGGSTARSDVARFMVKLATMDTKEFQTYNHKMPVIYNPAEKKV